MSRVTPVLLYSLTGAVVLSSLSSCKEKKSEEVNLKSASNLNGNLNCSKELEHYAS